MTRRASAIDTKLKIWLQDDLPQKPRCKVLWLQGGSSICFDDVNKALKGRL